MKRRSIKRSLQVCAAPVRLVVVSLVVLLLAAQSQEPRMVSGVVTDRGGNALSGAVVQLENTVTLNIQSYITRNQGEYQFTDLHPDVDFKLTAHYKRWWSKPVTLSKFNTARHAQIDLSVPID